MPLKFVPNLTFMFQDAGELTTRYKAAKDAGFTAVECGFPYDVPVEALRAAKEGAGVEQVLINNYPGDVSRGDAGLAAKPGRLKDFKEAIETSVKYAKALNCKKIHIMSGKVPEQWKDTAMEEVYIENLKYAAERLEEDNIMALIEPVNSRLSVPRYFMDHPAKALDIIEKVGHKNLKLQLDLFHVQIMDGNLTANIKKYLPFTGHIQIAQVPDRHEPNSSGEINFPYIFKVLEESGYDGYIGLEYFPKGSTVEGLAWMKEMGFC